MTVADNPVKPKGRFTIFSEEYLNRAKPKQLGDSYTIEEKQELENEIKVCKSCREPFMPGDFIHICKNRSGPKRRHVRCAINHEVITGEDVEVGMHSLMEQVAKDMGEAIPAALKSLAID